MGNVCQNPDTQSVSDHTGRRAEQFYLQKHHPVSEDDLSEDSRKQRALNNTSSEASTDKFKFSEPPQPQTKSQYKDTLNQLYRQCTDHYNEHYIDSAYEIASLIDRYSQELHRKHGVEFFDQNQQKFLERVKKEYRDMISYDDQINREGWQLKSDKNGIKTKSRVEEDGTVGVRIEALTDVPFEVLITVLIEINFAKDYMPFMQESKEEKYVARNCRIGYTRSSFPLLKDRQAFFQGVAYSRLRHSSQELFLYTRSIHDKPQLLEDLDHNVNIDPKVVQLDYKYFVIKYRPIKNNMGFLDMSMNVDGKMNYLPEWLTVKISKDFGEKFFKNIIRISKNFKGSQWEKNMHNNPELFLYYQKEVRDYLARKSLST